MCLALPAQIRELRDNDVALVELGGVAKEVSLALVDDVKAGDFVIVHVGYALSKIDAAEAARTLAMFESLGEVAQVGA